MVVKSMGNWSRCWLPEATSESMNNLKAFVDKVYLPNEKTCIRETLVNELTDVNNSVTFVTSASMASLSFIIDPDGGNVDNKEAYSIDYSDTRITISSATWSGLLYAWFHLLRFSVTGKSLSPGHNSEAPAFSIRMINHWDNMDGDIERGYSGASFFFRENKFIQDKTRVLAYARLLSSVGINAVAINNVNVHHEESFLIDDKLLPEVANIAAIFRSYGISLFLSVNFASPIELGDLNSADPLDTEVKQWWKQKTARIYAAIPDFGGFVVKADSEHRPGPFTYGRTHADGANMLADALAPYGGIIFWRCFVYNCLQDWFDKKTDRARAAWDHFAPLDGHFKDNVILQIKNGPMDFQVREPVSPLLGAMPNTNQVMELQIAQEYTGQQIDLCWLMPHWQEIFNFDTHIAGENSLIAHHMAGKIHPRPYSGVTAVINTGDSYFWTGHPLAQANLYGYGRLLWNPFCNMQALAREWCELSISQNEQVVSVVSDMLLKSHEIYENYTAPLGIGWMVKPHYHYGPSVDGYEYDRWGTYHYADRDGMGVDRTKEQGTGYVSQYSEHNCQLYNNPATCPDELVLFFHHLPYSFRLQSGKTVIQHIYDTHFTGVEQVKELQKNWQSVKDKIPQDIFIEAEERLNRQLTNAIEWRDQVNTYFYRKSGVKDERNRNIYS